MNFNSKVEESFYQQSGAPKISTQIPYITVDNFPKLGLMTALRFLEWVSENPNGVISLPTGKTPEFFIKYTQFLLTNWDNETGKKYRDTYGLSHISKPNLSGLHFVQIDEFYPISPDQHNSFHQYVSKYYIEGFGLNPENALLINSDEITLYEGRHFKEVFPDYSIDLSLRYREAKTKTEKIQQESLFIIDNWCSEYEQKIRDKGGIGFFLGGIGPDGHIAFNIKGSDTFSTTRLTSTNFETQAASAGDLGGIEISRNRLVITIGLETITYNPDAVALIFAAGESKAEIIKKSLESPIDVTYPASVLQRCKNSRFYITIGAAKLLEDRVEMYYQNDGWSEEKTLRSVIDLSLKLQKYVSDLTLDDLKADKYCTLIPNLSENTKNEVIDIVLRKLEAGMDAEDNQVVYHTGPHHDDIPLGIMPYINFQVSKPNNELHFSVLTSGFNAVTNAYVIKSLYNTLDFIANGEVQMLQMKNYFESGFNDWWGKDVSHFLDGVSEKNQYEKDRGLAHRLVRIVTDIYHPKSEGEVVEKIKEIIIDLEETYPGSVNSPDVQKLKGMIREFEEELVWGHYGIPVSNVHHLRLGFYKGKIFTEQPEKNRDIIPILDQFRQYQPTMISLVMDPEGSGPDTHYKVLQAIAGAVKEWSKEKDLSHVKIMGYRNVWFRYHPAEADIIVPVTLNDLHILQNSFEESYITQVDASFPSYEYDGTFSDVAQKTWVNQMRQIQLVLGKDYFVFNKSHLLKATHGMIYTKMLTVQQFIEIAEQLESIMEGITEIGDL